MSNTSGHAALSGSSFLPRCIPYLYGMTAWYCMCGYNTLLGLPYIVYFLTKYYLGLPYIVYFLTKYYLGTLRAYCNKLGRSLNI